jgi:hypothetical protein
MSYSAMRFMRDNPTAADAVNGYDYRNQSFVVDGKYVPCGHGKPCDCFGTVHAGQPLKANADVH